MCEHIKFCKNITFIAHFDGIESRKRPRATSVKQANKFKYDPILTFIALKCYIQLVVCYTEEKKEAKCEAESVADRFTGGLCDQGPAHYLNFFN